MKKIVLELDPESARVLASAANYVAKKRRKEAKRRPFIPQPGHYNLNERNAEILFSIVRQLLDELEINTG